jgi:hypothetical protein
MTTNMKKDGNRHWLRRKGCRNCAYQWIQHIHEDGSISGEFVIVPMVVEKEFVYLSHREAI